MITQEMFLNAELSQISQVYYGKDRCCRCGCKGVYTSTSFNNCPSSFAVINDSLVLKRLKKAKNIVLKGGDVDYGTSYVNIVTGKDLALCFYFVDVKG